MLLLKICSVILTPSYTGRGEEEQKVIALILIVNNFVDIQPIITKFRDFS